MTRWPKSQLGVTGNTSSETKPS